MKSKLFIVCESSALDARLQTLSAFHILEEVNAPGFPFVLPRLSIIAMLVREENDSDNPEVQIRTTIGDEQIFSSPLHVHFQNNQIFRTIADLFGFVVPAPGNLRFALRLGENEFASWEVKIEKVGVPQMEVHPVLAPVAEQSNPV
jgi:hypothetical protein